MNDDGKKPNAVTEISAGGVLYRCTDGGPEVVMIATRGGAVWGLPKGFIEPGEDAEHAACREVREETGLIGSIMQEIGFTNYQYRRKEGQTVVVCFKTVYFFLMEFAGGDLADHDDEVDDVRWYPMAEAIQKATHAGERATILKALDILREQGIMKAEPQKR